MNNYNKNDLIFDRTFEDIQSAYNSKTIENQKGCYNINDLNRLCVITEKIINELNLQYNADIEAETLTDVYTELMIFTLNDFNKIRFKIQEVVEKYSQFVEPIEFNIRTDNFFNYKEANKIEKALYDMCIGLNIN